MKNKKSIELDKQLTDVIKYYQLKLVTANKRIEGEKKHTVNPWNVDIENVKKELRGILYTADEAKKVLNNMADRLRYLTNR